MTPEQDAYDRLRYYTLVHHQRDLAHRAPGQS